MDGDNSAISGKFTVKWGPETPPESKPAHISLEGIVNVLKYCVHPLHVGRVEMHDGIPHAVMNETDMNEFMRDIEINLRLADERKDGTAFAHLKCAYVSMMMWNGNR